ncbi:MAG: DivIVA domain-containing protein [Candidatus Nanopelagicales bacterium]
MTFVFIAIAVVAGLTLVVVGRQGGLPDPVVDLRPEADPEHPRFDVVFRGYRMDEVDEVITRLQHEISRLRDGRMTRD